ncbi:MAG: RNA pseudouridine synthase [Candidatus Pelagibacter sp.]|jgi:23S rRNA pseudouridine955/2504/2580 synthase|nr:RNA pseudouridine synthase [Candidatus Pelagibacter sp.]|tara:strand:+ start:13634 stop:14554 length:921 start_codon:yes stop_codon:yes gene_type:complete
MDKIFLVKKDFVNSRIDRWIRRNIGQVPQSLIEKNLRNKNVTINKVKVKSSYKLKIDDKIYLNNFNPTFHYHLNKKKKYIPSKRDIKDSEALIVENNDNFCVINKPYGLAVQGGSKIKKNLVDLITENKIFQNSKPFIVHRIDKETSGILIIAKNRKYAQLFTSLFRIRKIHKSYLSICHGKIEKVKDIIADDLIRYDKDKKISEHAITNYKVLDKNSNSTLLILNPITGRKHQIRKQLFSIGYPIIGDLKYNYPENKINKNNNLMLHAYSIKFMINGIKYKYTVNVPDYFKKMLLKKRLTLFKYP